MPRFRHHGLQAARSMLIACLFAIALAHPAAASPKVVRAGHSLSRADRLLVVHARRAARCRRRCSDERRAVQRSGDRLTSSSRRLARIVQATTVSAAARRQAVPVIRVRGTRLSWRHVSRLRTYVLARAVPGQPLAFALIHGTRTTPPAVPGVTVTYSVRRAVSASQWAPPVAIAYPAAAPAPTKRSRPVDAPSVSASPQAVRWTRVRGVRDYIVEAAAPGLPTTYRVVRGTSVTPASLPGRTVSYSVRTAARNSAWAPALPVAFPAPVAPPPAAPDPAAAGGTTPAAAPAPTFQFGINSGGSAIFQLSAVRPLGARHARIEFPIETPVAEIAPTVETYARAGIQTLLLASFNGRLPSSDEARKLGAWAAAFGPGGTLWQGTGVPVSLQLAQIEFGNETNNPYQYTDASRGDDWWYDPAFLTRARTYAQRVKDAALAIRAANPAVGLLAVGDQYSGRTTWVDSMFQAVPDLGSYVAGWTVHPYGKEWSVGMDTMLAAFARHGAPARPLYATEMGFSTDDGRCLSDNYGWNKCMGFPEAATSLHATVTAMRARYGTRLAAIYLYAATDQSPPGETSDRERYFGALRLDRSPKGAYTTEVKQLLAASG